MISVKRHNKKNIIEIHYEDDIFLEELVDFINSLAEKESLPQQLKSVTFATKAKFKFTHSELGPIVEAMSRLSKRLNSLKEAFIIDSPQSVVLATTFKLMNTKTTNYRMEIFSTEEAALRWLGIDYLDLEKD
jgi:hypothetical protein